LIPQAKEFDLAQTESSTILQGNAITHSDNLNAWLYGVKVGSINETRYSVTLDDVRNSMLCNNQHFQSITLTRTMSNATGVANLDNASVISQLTYTISIQNKEAMESNNLHRKEFEKHIEREEKKKDELEMLLLLSGGELGILICCVVTSLNGHHLVNLLLGYAAIGTAT
jgi:hypothetical protein